MSNPGFIAFDLGASSGRGLVGELNDGKLIIHERYRFPNGMMNVRGRLHWDIFRLFEHIKEGLRRCAEESDPPPFESGNRYMGARLRAARRRRRYPGPSTRIPRQPIPERQGIILFKNTEGAGL